MGVDRQMAAIRRRAILNGSLRSKGQSSHSYDVILFNGPIYKEKFYRLLQLLREKKKNERCLLALTTLGGDIHSAFRVAKLLQEAYKEEFAMLICKECKDVGAMIVLAANSLFVAETSAELGPLNHLRDNYSDRKEVFRYQGTNAVFQEGLEILRNKVMSSVQELASGHQKSSLHTFVSSQENWQHTNQLVSTLFQPCFSRIDLFELGNYSRAVSTALKYAERLGLRNIDGKNLLEIIDSGFEPQVVLDYLEVKRIFKVVFSAQQRLPEKIFQQLFRLSDVEDQSVSMLDIQLNL